jgi:hypothetical protein
MSKKVPYQNLDADESEDLAFGGPCELIGGSAYNGHSAVTFLKIYDAAAVSAVTVGTTVPKFVIGIPATSAVAIPPADFTSGVVVACTLNAALADATDPVVGAVVNLTTT